MYIFPLITIFTNMERVAHRNESCNVWKCNIIPLITYFPNMDGFAHRNENRNVYVYIIPLDHLFPQHGGGCWEKWELQCLCVYIIPLVTYFANMEGVLTEMRIAMYMCILFPWSLISPNMEGVAHINENCNVYVYVIPLVTYFP